MRRSLLGLVVVLALLALFDVFGQSPSTTSAAAAAATLHVDSPGAVRGGLLYQVRFTVEAHRDLKSATLVLDTGWLDGLTVNTIEPSPVNEASRNGKLALELGHVPAGEKYVLFVDYQVNPTTVGTRTQTVALDDGESSDPLHRPRLDRLSLMDIVLRAVLAFGFIFFLTRVVGRRELSSLEPFDLIMLIVLGDLVQQGVTQSDYSVTGLVLAAGTIALMQVGVSYVNFRFKPLRSVLQGEPIVLIEDGRVLERNVRRERLTRQELEEQARLSQIVSLDDVRWAVLETSGQISFIPKQ